MLLWLFILGWCINFAKSRSQKLMVSIILPILALRFMDLDSSTWWVLVGGAIAIWQQYVSVPKIVKAPIQTVSAAAYYIYLTHMIWIHVFQNVAGIKDPFITATLAVVGGTICWYAQEWVKGFWHSTKKNLKLQFE
jgi:hypothetical protein